MEEKNHQENTGYEGSETLEVNPDMESSAKNNLKNLNSPNEEILQDLKELFQEQECQNLNIVIANTIQDSSFFQNQNNQEMKHPKDEKNYCLTQEKDFLLFMHDKKNSCLKLYLLMLLGVRVIETNKLNYYTEQLKLCIGWNEEDPMEDTDLPSSKVCHMLGVEQFEIEKRTQAGMMALEAIGYTEENIRILRKIFWRNYVNLREPLIQWLTKVNDGNQYPGAVLAGMGLADFAQLDFAFIYDRLIVWEKKMHSEAQISCITRIMKNAWMTEHYRDNISHLLQHWLEQNKSLGWLVSLTCYVSDSAMVDAGKLQKCLKNKIEIFSLEQKWAGFLILKAHQSPVLCNILYNALAELYTNAESKVEKEQICLQFLTMLFVESYFVSEKGKDLVFIQLLTNKECAKKQKPMLFLLLKTLEYRRLLQSILDRYFSILPKAFDKSALKNFIILLAFTGQKTDFENMIVYLKRKSGCGNLTIKAQLCRELQEILMQKKKRLEVR